MTQRIAAALSLVVFAVCLGVGVAADNPLTTVLGRAMVAMVVTLVIGLILGAMARRMLEENLRAEAEKIKKDSANAPVVDR